MRMKFSPSVNIERDFNRKLAYIPTPNSLRIFRQILNEYQLGIRAFNIIGSYGTGKSAFLWALEQHLRNKRSFFEPVNGQLNGVTSFKFLNIVGKYMSIVDQFTRYCHAEKPNLMQYGAIEVLERWARQLTNKNKCLVIIVDEFGKFLEYASANDPERELYFIQQLAEFANDSKRNVILITVLHQSFGAYARNLSVPQRQEWEKVKGRLKDIPFNEPVEQLLHLAAERVAKKRIRIPKSLDLKKLLGIVKKTKIFPLRTEISLQLAKKLYPFDIISAAILTKAFQEYGQNERSLFTFLESDEFFGLNYFSKKIAPYYNLCFVYDYLANSFSNLLTTKYNPHFFQWRAIRHAIDRVEGNLVNRVSDAIKIVKAIGLLNIFVNPGSRIDFELLTKYAQMSLGIENAGAVLSELENKKIIRFLNYKNQFVLFEGTDLNIEIEVERAAEKVSPPVNLVSALRKNFSFPYISAKAVSYKYGTPRFFQFKFSETPLEKIVKNEIDGVINLIFSEKMQSEDLIEHSKRVNEAILFGLYHHTAKIREILYEIEKIKYVIDKVVDDRVAERELRNMLEFQRQELNRSVLQILYQNTNDVLWLFNGKVVEIKSRFHFNHLLSEICENVYPNTPVFHNELINRHKIPTTISKARRKLLEALLRFPHDANLGFDKSEFPPEKTIYLTLLKRTGLHRKNKEGNILREPRDPSFKPLWDACEEFLNSAKFAKKSLSELVRILSSPPFRLKKGFIEFWLPIFLIIKRDDFALFGEDGFIPQLSLETLELITKKPKKFQIKTFELEGVKLDLFNKYRSFLNQQPEQRLSISSFIQTIKPFLSFYKGLPEYVQRTKKLSKSALQIREAIAKATEPEKMFFEDFPKALGYSSLKLNESNEALTEYIIHLQNSIRELRTCFDALFARIEKNLLLIAGYEGLSFEEYRKSLKKRYRTLKSNLLLPHQVVFYRQIQSELDDRKGWLRAVVQALLGKPIEKMRDEEEELIYEKLNSLFRELDNLCDISKIKVDFNKEDIVKLELTSPKRGVESQILRFPKQMAPKIKSLEKEVRSILGENKNLNTAVLIKLLREELFNE